MTSIGIYPGTFDPIHEGHVDFSLAALRACSLNEVYFLPESAPRNKTGVTDLGSRIERIERSLTQYPFLRVARLSSPQFTVGTTLPEIKKRFDADHYTLLIGSDVAQRLATWPEVDELLKTCGIAIGMRTGADETEIADALDLIEQRYDMKIEKMFIHTSSADVSSSRLRRPS